MSTMSRVEQAMDEYLDLVSLPTKSYYNLMRLAHAFSTLGQFAQQDNDGPTMILAGKVAVKFIEVHKDTIPTSSFTSNGTRGATSPSGSNAIQAAKAKKGKQGYEIFGAPADVQQIREELAILGTNSFLLEFLVFQGLNSLLHFPFSMLMSQVTMSLA